jgi:hypothetical protein
MNKIERPGDLRPGGMYIDERTLLQQHLMK